MLLVLFSLIFLGLQPIVGPPPQLILLPKHVLLVGSYWIGFFFNVPLRVVSFLGRSVMALCVHV